MSNPFDQFDEGQSSAAPKNPFDQFDETPEAPKVSVNDEINAKLGIKTEINNPNKQEGDAQVLMALKDGAARFMSGLMKNNAAYEAVKPQGLTAQLQAGANSNFYTPDMLDEAISEESLSDQEFAQKRQNEYQASVDKAGAMGEHFRKPTPEGDYYDPELNSFSFDKVAKNYQENGVVDATLKTADNIAAAVPEAIAGSVPYMVNAPVTGFSVAGDVVEERRKNSGDAIPSNEDLTAATGVGFSVGILERLLPKFLTRSFGGKSGEAQKQITDGAIKYAIANTSKEAASAGAIEFATEFNQNIIQYLGERIGTDAAIDYLEMFKQSAEQGVIGAGAGATMGAPSGAIRSYADIKKSNATATSPDGADGIDMPVNGESLIDDLPNQEVAQDPLQLEHNPQRMIVMPDGTTAWESEIPGAQVVDETQKIVSKHPAYPRLTETAESIEQNLNAPISVDDEINQLLREQTDYRAQKVLSRAPVANNFIDGELNPISGEGTLGLSEEFLQQRQSAQEAENFWNEQQQIKNTPIKTESPAVDYSEEDSALFGETRRIMDQGSLEPVVNRQPVSELPEVYPSETKRLPTKADARVDSITPADMSDVRLSRPEYRTQLERAASDLVEGGGVTYLRDKNDKITGRTPSVNPDWFKSANENPETSATVIQSKAAIQKALAGRKLGVREARMVGAALDHITGERGEYAAELIAKRQLARESRRAAFESWKNETNVPDDAEFYSMVSPDSAAERYAEQDYEVDLDYDDRAVSELVDHAVTMGADWKQIDAALELGDIDQQSKALTNLIWSARNEHRQTQARTQTPGRSGQGAQTGRSLAEEAPNAPPEITPEVDETPRVNPQTSSETPRPQPIAGVSVSEQLEIAASEAATSPDNDLPEPTEAQKEAGNYRKGHTRIHGLDIAIENPKGSIRSGTDSKGKKWESTMHSHYGYIRSFKPNLRGEFVEGGVTNTKLFSDTAKTKTSIAKSSDFSQIINILESAVGAINSAKPERLPESAFGNAKLDGGLSATESAIDKLAGLLNIPRKVADSPSIKPIMYKAASDSVSADAYFFGDPATAHAIRAKGFDSLGVKRQQMVQRNMLSAINDFEVFKSIIELVPVDVVNVLVGRKLSAKKTLDDHSVLLDAFSVTLNNPVKIGGFIDAVASNHPIAFAAPVAKEIFNASGKALSASENRSSTMGAGDVGHDGSVLSEKSYYTAKGADGEHLDVFIGPNPESQKVYVVDQINPDGSFDEHKVLMGFDSPLRAKVGYSKNYSKGWKVGPITSMSVDEFKDWLKNGDTKKPVSDEIKKASNTKALADGTDTNVGTQKEENQESVKKTSSDLPPILTKTKNLYVKQMAVAKGLKRGSPGYDNAFKKLEEDYEIELDKAYASLPFEKYNELNSDTSESINRQAWESLREEFGVKDEVTEITIEEYNKLKSVIQSPNGFIGEELSPLRKTAYMKRLNSALNDKNQDNIQWAKGLIASLDETKSENTDTKKSPSNKSSVDEDKLKNKAIRDGEIPSGLQPNYVEWIKSLSNEKRRELFSDDVSNTSRNAEFMAYAQQSKPGDVEYQQNIRARSNSGDIKIDEFKSAFESLIKNREQITAEISKYSKDKLISMLDPISASRAKTEKKEYAIESVYRNMVTQYFYIAANSNMMSISYSNKADHTQDYIDSVRPSVEAATQEDLDKVAKDFADSKRELEESKKRKMEGLKDPKTLDDFRNLHRAILEENPGISVAEARMKMTTAQRVEYDRLNATETRGKRFSKKEERKTAVSSAGQTVDGSIIETKHTKKGHDLFVVQLSERVSKEDYNTLSNSAKRLGGYYSSFRGAGAVPGFQFPTREGAQAFLELAGGNTETASELAKELYDVYQDNKSQTTSERLRSMAGAMRENAEQELTRDRKANTTRRAGMAARALESAEREKAMAETMQRIAEGIESGDLEFLDKLRTKAQLSQIQAAMYVAKGDELRTRYPDYSERIKHEGEPITTETVDHAVWPTYTAFRSDLAKLARQMIETDGLKLLGRDLLKVADDTSAEYTKFAKENLDKVSTFRKQDGSVASFKSKADAAEAIERSGFSGKAIPLEVKRGENRIILSASESQTRGIWDGADKRIDLAGEFAEKLIETAAKKNRKKEKVSVPWQLETAYEKRQRFKSMGIETPAEFRAALREYVGLAKQPEETSKVKKLELAMVGRKKDGLDFFPTPQALVNEMIGAAELLPGMKVLEPSAGMGHIADGLRGVDVEPDVVEISGERRELLEAKGYNLVGSDFMEFDGSGYDRIIMNPPFSDRRDMEHVRHAYDLLKPGGRIVAIVGEGVMFGSDKKATEFRDWLDRLGATSEKLEEGTFNDPSLPVTTGVNARMLVIDKPGGDGNVLFSLDDESPENKITKAEAEKVVENISKNWAVDVSIKIADSVDDFPERIKSQLHSANDKKINALFDQKTNEIWINLDQVHDAETVERMIFHEVYTHLGLRGLFGNSVTSIMGKLYMQIGGQKAVRDLAEKYGMNLKAYEEAYKDQPRELSYAIIAEELLAHMAEHHKPFVVRTAQELIGAIRAWLRKNGFMNLEKITESDMRYLLKQSREAITKGKPGDVLGLIYTLSDASPEDRKEINAMFSLPPESRKVISSDPLLAAWTMLAQDDDAFQLPISDKKKIEDIFSEQLPGMPFARAPQFDDGGAKVWKINPDKYTMALVFQKGDSVWIDVSDVETGQGGRRIYNAVANYAFNNDLVFVGDPVGLSDVALTRRLENMISSALKFGTTKHLKPHDRQREGKASIGVPGIKWKNGDDAHNLKEMITTSYNATKNQFPEIENLRYDPAIDEIRRIDNGKIYDRAAIQEIIEGGRAEGAKSKATITAGRTTLERAIFTNSILRGTREEQFRILAALGNQRTERLGSILYSLKDEDKKPTRSGGFSFGRSKNRGATLPHQLREAYNQLGGANKTFFEKVKTETKRQLAPRGLLPKEIFDLKISRDGAMNADDSQQRFILTDFYAQIQKVYDKPYHELKASTRKEIDDYLKGDRMNVKLTKSMVDVLSRMRAQIQSLSNAYIDELLLDAANLESEGKPEEAQQKRDLIETIVGNYDNYLHRSYRAFDDPDWPKKVPEEVYQAAVNYLAKQYDGDVKAAAKKVDLILHEGTAYDSMGRFISESKLGSKDLSVLKTRKQIAPEIRALLGEYEDPAINYAKSATKMTRLVNNTAFLRQMKDAAIDLGLLFDEGNRPLGAHKKIAGEASDVYSPLNGMYTYPEFAQALQDAVGGNKEPDWYKALVAANGAVKYGKTVLAPTTAVRNFLSASMFSLTSGHWDVTELSKSAKVVKTYFTGKDVRGSREYINKMLKLGVLYDAPNYRELQDLIKSVNESEHWLAQATRKSKVGTVLNYAQEFYALGDDFWKIMGFENEKAMLMKQYKMSDADAEKEAAERIRNTYPTYSLTGKGIQTLRRFPVVGAFPSFPAEIIRTTYHKFRYFHKDAKALGYDNPAVIAKGVGLTLGAGMMAGISAMSAAILGIDDEEEEAVRQMLPEWSRNSSLFFLGRDEDGQIQYMDLGWLDPYAYWKKPLSALARDGDAGGRAKDAIWEALSPFIGLDIAAGELVELFDNIRDTGVTAEKAASTFAKGLAPGIWGNITGFWNAADQTVTKSGKKYTFEDEALALLGFRKGTLNAKVGLTYQAYGYLDQKRAAAKTLRDVATDMSKVDLDDMRSAYERSMKMHNEAWNDMRRTVKIAMKAGLTKSEAVAALRTSGVSKRDAAMIVDDMDFAYKPSKAMMKLAIRRAAILFDEESAAQMLERAKQMQELQKEYMEKPIR